MPDNPFKEGTYGLEPGGSYDQSRARGYMSDIYNTSTQGYQGKIKRQGQEATEISDAVPRLPDYAKPGEYNTKLDSQTEQEFQQWVQQNKIPFDPKAPVSDYDMRGYFKALKSGDPKAKQEENQNDGKMHFPDYWKTPYHESFSADSQWADPIKAPRWNSKDQLVTPDGKVIFDERKKQTERVDKKAEENKFVLQELKTFLNKHDLPADVDQLLSGDYPLGIAAVGKAMRQLHDLESKDK
jgi:hypothetical protein